MPRPSRTHRSPAQARPTRRTVGRQPLLLAAGLALAAAVLWFATSAWRGHSSPDAARGPIVLISIDTLRADRLPIYGYRKIETPAVSSLAADGVVFEHAWAHSPQTLPSHASIFTGQLPFEHGVRDNMGFVVKPGATTLAGQLALQGYATAGFVSAYVMRQETGVGQGFAAWDDRLPPTSPEIATGEVQRDGADTLAAVERWLDAQTSDRFFLFVHLYEPHTPYEPPPRFAALDPYDGEIAYADELVGRLLESLRRRGWYDPALVVFLSDHGEGLGDHGEMEHGIFLYSETIRVPLVVKLPGRQRAGTRLTEPVQHIDLLPTVLALAGAPMPGGLRGRSLAPLFQGGSIPEQGLYAEALYPRYHFGWSELYALTDARYRFIRAPRDELYDLAEDAGERRNLAESRGATRLAMRQGLERLLAGRQADQPSAVSAEDRERLRALGYVATQAEVAPGSGADTLPDPKDRVHVLQQYRDALELVRDGEIPAAMVGFERIVAENPAMADVWSEIAGLLVRQGRLEEALAAYKRLVETAPFDPAAIVSVAQTLIELGRLDEAVAQADLALTLLPASEGRWRGAAHKMLMRVALERNDAARARLEARRGQDADPSMPLVEYAEGLIRFGAGQFAEAVPHLQAALDESASRTFQVPDLRYYLGDALGRLERHAEAERQFLDELRLFPGSLRAAAGLAMLYRVQDRVNDSNVAIETMLRRTPTPQAYALAAKLWAMFGDTRRAAAAEAGSRRPASQAPAPQQAPR